jgi:beta-N-acetylhexosaminidase
VLELAAGAAPPELDARPLVVALRDASRHGWQRELAERILARRPDAVVVETGLPGWLPSGARATVETLGAARVSLEAAAQALVPD